MAQRDPPPPQPPLSVTWRDWIAGFPEWPAPDPDTGLDSAAPEFDAIVIGSGYGGSVAALRLVQKGYRTLLLERGSEYLPGEFPNDFSLVPKSFRINIPTQGVPAGRASGLIELHLGQGLVGLTGNGLGGGSLINAGVAIEPDPDVFVQPEWPAEIRHGMANHGLQQFFDLASTTLQAQSWIPGMKGAGAGDPPLLKTQALGRLAPLLARGAKAETVTLTIDPEKCIRCGDCASGCNVVGAKKTLPSTYLQNAIDETPRRLQIVTQAEVYRFYPAAPGDAGGPPLWGVEVFSTEVQHQYLATRELLGDRSTGSTVRQLSAPLLFVCAGTFGSTQLMQRSQALVGRDTMSLSPTLGTRLSGNGDSISVSTAEKELVNSVGQGCGAEAAWEAGSRTRIVGPTITAMIDLRDCKRPLDRRVLIQDGAVPRTIARLYHELLATSWTLKQLGNWWFDRLPASLDGHSEDPLAASSNLAQHSQVLLAMGHDGSPARMVWLDCYDRAAPYLADAEQLVTYKEQQRLWDALGRRHVHNPLWRALPESVLGVLSGPKPPHTVTTVHPLGGCVMGDEPESSVVNHLGQVWVHDPGRQRVADQAGRMVPPLEQGYSNAPRTYQGLYVVDGSIVPTALGCNPLLTITALAERILDALPPFTSASHSLPGVRRSPDRQPQAIPSANVPIAAVLNETLMAENAVVLRGSLKDCLGAARTSARLSVVFESEDLPAAMCSARHLLPPRALLALANGKSKSNQAMLVYASSAGDPAARFEALPANWTSAGPWLLIGALGQTVLLLILAVLVMGLAIAPLVTVPTSLLHGVGLLARAVLGLLVGGAGWLAALVALPFSRTALTWLALRGWKDIRDRDRAQPFGKLLLQAVDAYRQWVHASETRTMVYRIPMTLDLAQSQHNPRVHSAPQSVTLHARKSVTYRARVGQVLRWVWGLVRKGWRRGRLVPMRETIWEQVMDAQVKLVAHDGGPSATCLASGRFRMGLDSLLSPGRLDGRNPLMPAVMQLGPAGDSTSGLLALASYPMLYLRFALKTRLFDFRLPSYSNLPVRDDAPLEQVTLRSARGRLPDVVPESHWLSVPRGVSSNDQADEAQENLRLRLWRYRRREATGQPCPPEVDLDASWRGIPVARAKSVLLLHAFGQSGLSFTFQQTEQNLAEAFWQEGYEVWILEMRMSTRSGQADHPSTVDMIAQHDIPVAAAYIVESLASELDLEGDRRKLQICAFAQCIGAAALWMALLDGRLCHGPADPAANADGSCLSMLSHAVFSQVHPWLVGSRGTQAKTWVPALLRGLLRQQAVPFAVRGPQPGWLAAVMDRLFASMPVPPLENREIAGKADASATCKRIRFVEAPLFEQAHLNDDTFAAMNLLFGDANLRLFSHARRFVENQRLVDEDANNRYVTDANIRKHLDFPIQLLHGRRNRLFDVAGADHSFLLLRGIHGGWQDQFCKMPGATDPAPVIINGYGHLDVLIGARAHRHVYPRVLSFMKRCQETRAHSNAVPPDVGWVLRGPKVGPLLGWIRLVQGDLVVRFSCVLDEYDGVSSRTGAPPMIVRYRALAGRDFVSLAGRQVESHVFELKTYAPESLEDGERERLDEREHGGGSALRKTAAVSDSSCAAQTESTVARRTLWADVRLERFDPAGFELQVFSVHEVSHPSQPHSLPGSAPDDRQIAAFLAGPGISVGNGMVVRPPVRLAHRIAPGSAPLQISAAPLAALASVDEVSFAASCCRYPGLALDLERIDTSVDRFVRGHGASTAFALLLGDQIYADATAGLIDPISPLERFYERHETAFSSVKMREFLASVPTCMTPDDHEWTDGFPDGKPLVMEHWPDWQAPGYTNRQLAARKVAFSAVTGYQRLHSEGASRPGRPYDAFISGCVRVFVFNTRSARKRGQPKVASAQVLDELQKWLRQGQAEPQLLSVVATGSVLLPGLRPDADPASPGPLDNWQLAPEQRKYVLGMLNELQPRRFLLISGDYHVSAAVEILGSDGTCHGAAIVAPPLYAPLPYANAKTDALAMDETIAVGNDTLQLRPAAGGDAQRGSGIGRITVSRQGAGFEIRYDRDLWVWEAGAASVHSAVIALP